MIHVDTNGPHITGNLGEKYFITFVDDISKIAKVFTVKAKNEFYDCLVEYVNLVESLRNRRVKKLRCDKAKEMLCKGVYNFTKQKGIYIEPCPPYVHELNGTAKMYNRSVMETARCLLAYAKLDIRF